jgi:Na+/melibiose symporter-like transporter
MLPSITFSRPIRSTLNGLCAACGKIGALLGALLFLPLAAWFGDAQVIKLCGCVSLVGAVLTYFFIDYEAIVEDGKEGSSYTGDCAADELKRLSSEAHLMELRLREQEERSPRMHKELSMPTFLDLPIDVVNV